MFVQFIEGQVSDPQALHDRLDQWQEQLADAAVGWLGATAGVTAEGTAVIAARFESAEAAQANSDRTEQGQWWAQTESLFNGEVSFFDAADVEVFRRGGSDEAGFVQVIRGQVNDIAAARELMLEDMPDDVRPDVIGGLVGIRPDGAYVTAVYFTSEGDARAGEAAEAADTDDSFARRMDQIHDEPPRFLDLPDPWMWSA